MALALPRVAHCRDLFSESLMEPQSIGMSDLATFTPDKQFVCDARFRDRLMNTLNLNICLLVKSQNCLFSSVKAFRPEGGVHTTSGLRKTILPAGIAIAATDLFTTRMERALVKSVIKSSAKSLLTSRSALLFLRGGLWASIPATIAYDLRLKFAKEACYNDSRYVDEHIDFEGSILGKCVPKFSILGPRLVEFIDRYADDPDGMLTELQSKPMTCEFYQRANELLVKSIRDEMALRRQIKLKTAPVCLENGAFNYEIQIEDAGFRISTKADPASNALVSTRYEAESAFQGSENYLVSNKWIGSTLIPSRMDWVSPLGVPNSITMDAFLSPGLPIPQRDKLLLAMRYTTLSNPVIAFCCAHQDSEACLQREFNVPQTTSE